MQLVETQLGGTPSRDEPIGHKVHSRATALAVNVMVLVVRVCLLT